MFQEQYPSWRTVLGGLQLRSQTRNKQASTGLSAYLDAQSPGQS
jgi:hypothetical protein